MDIEKHFDRIYQDYDRYLIVPVALILLSFLAIGYSYYDNGEIFDKGIDFGGGSTMTYNLSGDVTTSQVQQAFADQGWPGANAMIQRSGSGNTYINVEVPLPLVNGSSEAADVLSRGLERNVTERDVVQYAEVTAAASAEFFMQAQIAFVLAFTVMSVVIFIAFRDIIPAAAVILAAGSDILFAAAGMALFSIPLTRGSIAALLMLIGYSVDTDIVLSARVLQRDRNSLKERIWNSVKTGVTMSSGGIAGFIILYAVSMAVVGPSELSEIASVMVIGLFADMPFTWLGNAIILKKYRSGEFESLEKKMGEILPWS
ncbi:MAG: hypothetical protein ABEK01_05845 [Candidatus Nanohaloarchaea archaeon]